MSASPSNPSLSSPDPRIAKLLKQNARLEEDLQDHLEAEKLRLETEKLLVRKHNRQLQRANERIDELLEESSMLPIADPEEISRLKTEVQVLNTKVSGQQNEILRLRGELQTDDNGSDSETGAGTLQAMEDTMRTLREEEDRDMASTQQRSLKESTDPPATLEAELRASGESSSHGPQNGSESVRESADRTRNPTMADVLAKPLPDHLDHEAQTKYYAQLIKPSQKKTKLLFMDSDDDS